jgi:hypothetical protein
MNTSSRDQNPDQASEEAKPCTKEAQLSTSDGFEDFDLDDIDVIESKVFA